MNLTERDIARVVRDVLQEIVAGEAPRVSAAAAPAGSGASMVAAGVAAGRYGQFDDPEQAVLAAAAAQKDLMTRSIEERAVYVAAIRAAAERNAEMFARISYEETGIGRYPDKVAKNILAARQTPGIEDVPHVAFSGDKGLTLEEWAPFGVIVSLTPINSPTALPVNHAIAMIAGGNAVVVNPHPSCKRATMRSIEVINRAVVDAGGPDNLMTGVTEPTMESGDVLMSHRAVSLVVATGGPAVVRAAMESGKRFIAAGPGNPPVVVDSTADLANAAKCIFDGIVYENGILCIAEKVLVAVEKIADELKAEFLKLPVYELKGAEFEAYFRAAVDLSGPKPKMTSTFVGKDATFILDHLGIRYAGRPELLLAETPADHPLVFLEQLQPFLPMVRKNCANAAVNFAMEAEQGFGHSAFIHSKNVEVITRLARLADTSLFVANGSSLAGLGAGGEGYPGFTIATKTGEGICSAKDFVRRRRAAFIGGLNII